MNNDVKRIINSSVLDIINNTSSDKKLKLLKKKHEEKIHFIPYKYRIFGGLLQSMNIQFGNFIEVLMTNIIKNENKYEIIEKYSGKKSNKFELSVKNDNLIDNYITKCQSEEVDLLKEFPLLLKQIVEDNSKETLKFKHDIDVLFKNKETKIIYYLEVKYNDDHDTGKFIDINRKFIKTYAYLIKELNIKKSEEIVPILFFFTNKKMKGNIYIPEKLNIKRGKNFFEEFLSIKYDDVDNYMKNLSEKSDIIKMFEELYKKVMEN